MRGWQKGMIYAGLFVFFISLVNSVSLIIGDIMLEKKGLPHMCFIFTEGVRCTFQEAVETRIALMLMLMLVFGVPLMIVGGVIGYIIDRISGID